MPKRTYADRSEQELMDLAKRFSKLPTEELKEQFCAQNNISRTKLKFLIRDARRNGHMPNAVRGRNPLKPIKLRGAIEPLVKSAKKIANNDTLSPKERGEKSYRVVKKLADMG